MYEESLFWTQIVKQSVTEVCKVTSSTEKIKGARSNYFFLRQNQRASDEAINRADKWRFLESLEL